MTFEHAIRDEVSRILESPIFVQSGQLGRLLRFTVELTLAGEGETLKECLIGTEVYDRPPSHRPSEDSIVRSEARRLRGKLKEYYESVGRNDRVCISYRPGSYVPIFRNHSRYRGNKCSKVVAEITPTDVMTIVQQRGRFLDQQQALAFLNEGNRAYILWKQMMHAAEDYVTSVLVDRHSTPHTLTSGRGAGGRILEPQNVRVYGRRYRRLLGGSTREDESVSSKVQSQ